MNMTATAPRTTTMKQDKQCKGSVRYATADEEYPIRTLYVSREWKNPMPESISVTINPEDPEAGFSLADDKQCKSSVRYAALDDDAPVSNVYVDRSFESPMPGRIRLQID